MADQFAFTGLVSTLPIGGDPSFAAVNDIPIDESVVLSHKHGDSFDLPPSVPVVVPFGGVVTANIVILKARGGPAIATLTPSSGPAAQVLPFDSYLILMSQTNGYTALSLAAAPGFSGVSVDVFLGSLA